MVLYNTLTRKKEEFKPITEGNVLFYHCGPTVYWTQHIGNLRGMTMGDLLVRTLRYFGYTVTHVRNYTDVGHLTSDADTGEDKMEKGVKREHLTASEIAQKYIDIFEHDVTAINLVDPTFKPRPSLLIPEIIDMVSILIEKGFAYTTDLAVYFDVSKFPQYTDLSHQNMEKNIEGKGKGDVEDPQKKHFSDFALWVFKAGTHVNALQTWSSPFHSNLVTDGVGFPGWHIECSVMAKKYLGPSIDIHMGGIEHIPIHHTNEIAQSESANGVKFVNYWIHNGHLLVNEGKMAKSEGTGFSLAEIIEKGFDPLALRYFFLTAQYRSQQNFTWEALTGSQKALSDLRSMVVSWKTGERQQLSEEKLEQVDEFRKRFQEALENDINVPSALAIVWEMAKSNIPSSDKYDLIMEFDQVLGLRLDHLSAFSSQPSDVPVEIKQLGEQREKLRKEKKFEEADAVRKEIESKGYILEDSSIGTVIKKFINS
jgi:cysteinyl-tRNA synthetase